MRNLAHIGQTTPALRKDQPNLRNIRYRQIRPEDWRRLQRFHRRLSGETVELRFHGAKRELSEPLAHRFTTMDGVDEVAWIATTGTWGNIVGVARYSRITSTSAEVAFVIEDRYQGHGIGSRLLKRLREHALKNGITQFVAEVLPYNTTMLRLLKQAGPTTTTFDCGVFRVTADLLSSPDNAARR